jgi:hypothetical protein
MSELKAVLEKIESNQVPVENVIEKGKKKRPFTGFKADLILNNGKIIHIRYAPLEKTPLPKVIAKVGDKIVHYGATTQYQMAWHDDEGKTYTKDQIQYFQEVDGKLIPCELYERTKTIQEIKRITYANAEQWIPEDTKQIWSEEDVPSLLELAKDLQKSAECLVARFSFGGSKSYWAIIYPMYNRDRFVLVMKLSRQQFIASHWMDTRVQMPQQKQAKLIEALPEI